jgi:hypothetical protein
MQSPNILSKKRRRVLSLDKESIIPVQTKIPSLKRSELCSKMIINSSNGPEYGSEIVKF